MLPALVKRNCALSVIASTLFLTACAHKQLTRPADSLTLPPTPSLSTPLPSTPYTTTAAEDMERWQTKLQGTQLMSAPSLNPGR